MKIGFYPRFAFDTIRKNKMIYFPYILTSIGMVMMDYIITFLQYSKAVNENQGGGAVSEVMGLGSFVVGAFSLIFLFYTNSFLLKKRKKEFGLYNILGMGKFHLIRIIFWETLISVFVSIFSGLVLGIAFSKLAELMLVKTMGGKVIFDINVSFESVLKTVTIFIGIFTFVFLTSIISVLRSSTIDLIKGENKGEKPPKANWIVGIVGFIILGIGYYIAISVKNAVDAVLLFFVAVLFVIVGTYILFVAGSVLICSILKKSKKFYYKKSNFVAVSSMNFRMKRNGAGLASICILATMVLVTLSTTASLYFGVEEALDLQYPCQLDIQFQINDIDTLQESRIEYEQAIDKALKKNNGNILYKNYFAYIDVFGEELDGQVNCNIDESSIMSYDNVHYYYFLSIDEYNAISGENIIVKDGEAYIITSGCTYMKNTLTFGDTTLNVVSSREGVIKGLYGTISSFYIVVSDIKEAYNMLNRNWQGMPKIFCQFFLDTDLDSDGQDLFIGDIHNEATSGEYKFERLEIKDKDNIKESMKGSYSGFFFLGTMLSLVFAFSAGAIIYYKQVSEGYEDKSRYEIMKNIGMTDKEIKSSVNTQLLTVFYMPLIMAGIHIIFAFPMIKRILTMFGLINDKLFIGATLLTFLGFAIIYVIIYKLTSIAYLKIVSKK